MELEKEYLAGLLSEIHELNVNIIALANSIDNLKKYMVDVKNRVVWVQQNLGLRRMPSK
ncbi:unnamed protein product [marine sediment metagenome]|uniref:Uncharacterized protein n=1 Tax=marine sediment metagenome TaxID=412755 RepID=X1MS46_9ZZZZ